MSFTDSKWKYVKEEKASALTNVHPVAMIFKDFFRLVKIQDMIMVLCRNAILAILTLLYVGEFLGKASRSACFLKVVSLFTYSTESL